MAKKRSIRGLEGVYKTFEIERYPRGTMAAGMRNPYMFNEVEGNVISFYNLKTRDVLYYFIPHYETAKVVELYNNASNETVDMELFEYCNPRFLQLERTSFEKQTFDVIL